MDDRGSSLVMLDFVPLVGTYFLSQSYDIPELLTLDFSLCCKINTRRKKQLKEDFRTEGERKFQKKSHNCHLRASS